MRNGLCRVLLNVVFWVMGTEEKYWSAVMIILERGSLTVKKT